MNILIVSGGSGGHVYPAISLIKEIKHHNIIYLGTNSKLEKRIIPKLLNKFYLFNTYGLKKGLKNKIKFIYSLILNFFKVYKVIKKENINKIIVFGGYSSTSVSLLNIFLKKDLYIHEQNAIIGRNNKIFLKYCKKIFTSFKNTIGINEKYQNKIIYTGNPRIIKCNKKSKEFNILIMTGSLGSSSVNKKLLPLLDMYENIQMINGINTSLKHTKIIEYVENMDELLSKTSLVITRAGATSLNEISSLGIPAIIIPSPYVVNNHQLINAKEYLKLKSGFLIEEKDLNIDVITKYIDIIKSNRFKYEELSNNSKKFFIPNSINIIKKEMEL